MNCVVVRYCYASTCVDSFFAKPPNSHDPFKQLVNTI